MLIVQISDFHLLPIGELAYKAADTASALRKVVDHINGLVPVPDVALPLDRRSVGGMGVHMMRQLTDELSYRTHCDGWNELVLVKRGVRNR